eukprot:9935-Heterococcus_DN1.PRE.4
MLHPAAVTVCSISVAAEQCITATYNELQRLMTPEELCPCFHALCVRLAYDSDHYYADVNISADARLLQMPQKHTTEVNTIAAELLQAEILHDVMLLCTV